MLQLIVIGIASAVAIILALAFAKPATFSVKRSITIKAPPQKILPLVHDFRNWVQWSPWEKLDPAMQKTYGGPASGVGHTYAWQGNKKVGSGRMEITEVVPSSKVLLTLDFLAPFEAHNMTEFTFAPTGDLTEVTWNMYGPNTVMTKVMQVFTSMDRMVGKDFESGLAAMKVAVEK